MGCDHYLMLMRKPTEEELAHARKRMPWQTDLYAFAEDDTGVESLEKIGTWDTGFATEFDFELFKKDNGIPDEYELISLRVTKDGETHTYANATPGSDEYDPKTRRVVSVTDYEIEMHYKTYKQIPRLYVHKDDIIQWRNRSDIREMIRRHQEVNNCDYHILDDETIAELIELDPSVGACIKGRFDDEYVVYHEWY